MKSWIKELLCVALAAATAAVVLPRVVLSPHASAPRAPVRYVPAETAPEAPSPPEAPAAVEAPADEPVAEAPPDAPEDAGASSRRARAASRTQGHAAPAPPRGITHVGRRWVADLRMLPPVRTALAGTSLAPPGEGPQREGYRVVSTDRMGLLRSAGIRPGDVLIGVNGMPLRNPDDAIDALSRLRGASRATFEFQRGASRYQVPVELVGRAPGHTLVL